MSAPSTKEKANYNLSPAPRGIGDRVRTQVPLQLPLGMRTSRRPPDSSPVSRGVRGACGGQSIVLLWDGSAVLVHAVPSVTALALPDTAACASPVCPRTLILHLRGLICNFLDSFNPHSSGVWISQLSHILFIRILKEVPVKDLLELA